MQEARTHKIAIYAGTFDPITNGHLDIIKRALKIFDSLHIVVATNSSKHPMFPAEERVRIIDEVMRSLPEKMHSRVIIKEFTGLLVNYVRACGAKAIVRGLRAVSDYEYEAQMAHINRSLDEEIETVFLVTSSHCSFISSSVVKEIARHGGDVAHLVPPYVAQLLETTEIPST